VPWAGRPKFAFSHPHRQTTTLDILYEAANRTQPDVIGYHARDVTDAIVKNLATLRDQVQVGVCLIVQSSSARQLQRALDTGVRGIVHATSPLEDLQGVLNDVAVGRTRMCGPSSEAVLEELETTDQAQAQALQRLTERETEIVSFIADGMTSGEIAKRLHLSQNTVDTHRRSAMNKLDIHRLAWLTKFAIRQGLTQL